MSDQVATRTVRPMNEVVRNQRTAKGWTVEELATRAQCSTKTVLSIEKGNETYRSTLRRIADALGVPYSALVEGGQLAPSPPPRPSVKVRIEVDIPFENFDESSNLIEFVKLAIDRFSLRSEVGVFTVETGSTIIVLETARDDYLRLAKFFFEYSVGDDITWLGEYTCYLEAPYASFDTSSSAEAVLDFLVGLANLQNEIDLAGVAVDDSTIEIELDHDDIVSLDKYFTGQYRHSARILISGRLYEIRFPYEEFLPVSRTSESRLSDKLSSRIGSWGPSNPPGAQPPLQEARILRLYCSPHVRRPGMLMRVTNLPSRMVIVKPKSISIPVTEQTTTAPIRGSAVADNDKSQDTQDS